MDNEKMDGLSIDIAAAEQDKLRAVFPQCFTEGVLDERKLLQLLGAFNTIDENDREKYEFRWKGKQESLQLAGKRSAGTLRPCPEESVDWDTTQNLYIEGDNLEVLKILQTAYFRKAKMIYIDPPYNTGNDFVYADDFADPLARYREITQQTTKSNPESMGRFHTNWLNMMYPRLRLAANLLRDDGVIFISIDDGEVSNLRKVCDEILGEENFVALLPRVTKKAGKSTDAIASNHDFLLVYKKSWATTFNLQTHTDEGFKFEDEFVETRGKYKLNQTLDYDSLQYSPSLDYPIKIDGETLYPGNSYEKYLERKDGKYSRADWAWRWSKELFDYGYENGFIVVKKYDNYSRIYTKTYQSVKIEKTASGFEVVDIERTKPLSSLEFVENQYSNDNAKKQLLSLFETAPFDFSKPVSLLKFLVSFSTSENDIILDFFSGSATTAHAVMQLNAEDSVSSGTAGNRRFICVQLPEMTDEKSEAFKAGYKNICEIGKERIRRAGQKIYEEGIEKWTEQYHGQEELPETVTEDGMIESGAVFRSTLSRNVYGKGDKSLDIGFRVFKLDSSNLKLWDDMPITGEDAITQLEARIYGMLDIIKSDRTNIDVVYEVMLKLGQQLTQPILPIELKSGRMVHGVGTGEGTEVKFIVCLAYGITPEDADEMANYAPGRIIFSDSCFDNSEQKSNVRLTLKDKGIAIKAL